MSLNSGEWKSVFTGMKELAGKKIWRCGQEDTIRWIAERLKKQTGVLVADEVGMGKTRVVMATILTVLQNGGSVAAVVPPGLIYQWKKEWDEFLSDIKKSAGKEYTVDYAMYSPIMLRTYSATFEDNTLAFPLAKKNGGKWLLISHQFSIPSLNTNSRLKRYMLPLLAAVIRHKEDNLGTRSKFWEHLNNNGWDEDCLNERCDNCGKRTQQSCRFDIQVKRAAHFLSNKRWGKYRNLPDIRRANNAKEFFGSKDGLQMLGDLLGPVDLLVIDEAHKSRDTEKEQKILGKLLRNILKLSANAKRIGLTATPMELSSDQWKTIFERIGEGENYPAQAVNNFQKAYESGNKHSDNSQKVKALIQASKGFTMALKPFVTRRRRMMQTQMQDLMGAASCKNEAHPHRKWATVEIKYSEIETNWRPAVFALEAIGKTAKGCSVENDQELNKILRKLKLLDSRYAAGKIGKVELEADEEENQNSDILDGKRDEFESIIEKIEQYLKTSDNIEQTTLGKLHRIMFWLEALRVKNRNLDLAGHPRIQRIADEIENLVWNENGEIKEKVLVFGTFVAPLKTLRDVLNRRAVLRILDRKSGNNEPEPPLPGAKACLSDIDGIWAEFKRMKTIPLKREYCHRNIGGIIEEAGNAYERLQKKIEDHINESFVSGLPGSSVIRSGEPAKNLPRLLRARLISNMISRNKTVVDTAPKKLKMEALSIWVELLESYFDSPYEPESADTENHVVWEKPTYFSGDEKYEKKLSDLNCFACNLDPAAIQGFVEMETEEHTNRFGAFARMLYGGVKMETRRSLQAQFNTRDAFPLVLIAQSQVGREGLNLHKACRTVAQFHSEWNPGVVEQQIGRVDRIESFWEAKAVEWKSTRWDNSQGDKEYQGPKIIIKPIIFEGTYDAFQYDVSKKRRETLNAHLFGELLTKEALERLPEDGEWKKIRDDLRKVAPDFSPTKSS
ncbi:MAG: DEAD/DEAH box helicase family protein [Nitrospina sp.]|jgi:hypothetical protein|nr:DEAD/DEAH box helicase family protein [Nitrospina sp.]